MLNPPKPSEFYTYCLVRRDMPLAAQVVQVGHACLEAGRVFEQPDNGNLVVITVLNEPTLLQSVKRLEQTAHVKWTVFYEPDDNLGYTAACTAPICDSAVRQEFDKFSLWRRSRSS